MLVTFDIEQVGALVPNYLHLDVDLRITSVGPALNQHLPELRIGDDFAALFTIPNFDSDQFFAECDGVKPLKIQSRAQPLDLFGAAMSHAHGYLLVVRHIMSDETFGGGKAHLSDFGHADPVVLSTMLIALQRAMLAESQATAIELAHERERGAQMLNRMSRIAGYMAHDFNNLLSIIRLNTDRLLRSFRDDDKIASIANIIQETASRGSEMTKSLMTLSQQRVDTTMPIIVDDIIREHATFLASVVGTNIDLCIDLGAQHKKSVISYNGLFNSLINLLINAREAMPEGGNVTLATSLSHGLMTDDDGDVGLASREYIAIRITDDGPGMNESLLSRAFEPLFSSKPNGSGLGLASVRDFAIETGGDVRLASVQGEGTTVSLQLPVVDPPAGEGAEGLGATLPAALGQQKILLVEDEPYALEALAEMLEGEGYAVTPCRTSDDAMIALEQDAYHLLLTDIVMPGKDGTEIARYACAGQPSIKVVLMSGYVPDSASLEPGWMFLRKPMDSGELMRLISASV
jgi:signal transduction histidine kinase/CheY-like chemotaxis protein